MAMPSENVVIHDKMLFPSGGGGGGSTGGDDIAGEIYLHQYQQQWFVDERDYHIGWMQSEFAAANAIIDSLCHHLLIVGDPGEYDMVIGAINQRRCNWNQVLLMQQYFSVADVVYALQQVAWRRQHRYLDPVKVGAKEGRKYGFGYRQGQRFEAGKEGYNSSVQSYSQEGNTVVTGGAEKGTPLTEKSEEHKSGGKDGKMDDKGIAIAEEKKDGITKQQTDVNLKSSGSSQGSLANSESEVVPVNDGSISNFKGNSSHTMQSQHQSQSLSTIAKTFTCNEMFDGKMVNVVDGMKLYEDLFDGTEVSKLVSLVNDLRASGKRGQFQGSQTYVFSRRPMKGHGREMIQLGVPIADAPPNIENMIGSSKDMIVEPIPSLFKDIIERMVSSQVMTVKPDCCIVDFYNEGDHSHPHSWPLWFGRPVYTLFLTECEMTFGRVIASNHPGDYRGALNLSFVLGSLLAVQGKSADFAKHAIPSMLKQRILVTFTKSQPKKSLPSDAQCHALPATSHWGPPSSQSPNHNHHHVGPNHYTTALTTGVLLAPPLRPQILAPNGMQPLFVTAPVVPLMPFPAPLPISLSSAGWTINPPKHPPPRIPAPGTGVFLPPPDSGNSSQHLHGALNEVNSSLETPTTPEKENEKSSSNKMEMQECYGHMDGEQIDGTAAETQQDTDDKDAGSH